MKIVQKYRGKIILRRIFAVCFGLAAVCILLSCILGFGWFRVSQIQQQESDYESRMDTYVLVLQNYGKSMENVVTVLENDVYIRKLINRNTFTWDNTAGIAAQEVTNLVSVNPMIHSVYVWLEDDYLIKSTNPSYPIDQNGDARMLDIFQMSTFHESAVIPYLDIYGTLIFTNTKIRCLYLSGINNPPKMYRFICFIATPYTYNTPVAFGYIINKAL